MRSELVKKRTACNMTDMEYITRSKVSVLTMRTSNAADIDIHSCDKNDSEEKVNTL